MAMPTLEDMFPEEMAEPAGYNLIDFSQLVVATILHTYEPTDTIDLELTRHLILNTIRFNVLKQKDMYPNIVICIDNPNGGGYWRRKKAWYYKKHRDAKRDESGYDWDEIFKNVNVVVEEIKANLPYLVIDIESTEADDVIAVLAKHISENVPGSRILITSGDGDFTQLHKYRGVKQYAPIMKKWVTPKFGSARRDLLTKIVKGDPKDTISNIFSRSDFIMTKVDGERQKSVTKTLLAKVYDAKDPKTLFTGDQLSRYNENEMLLDFDMIPDSIRDTIIERFNTTKPAPKRLLYPYFVRNKLVKLIESISEF